MRKAATELGWGKALLIGHSFGGSVALAWTLDAPETVSGLMLLAAPSHVWSTGPSLRNRIASNPIGGPILANLAAAFVPDRMIEASIRDVFAPQAPPDNYAEDIAVRLSLQPDVIQANATDLVRLKTHIHRMVPLYDSLTMPVEIIHGTADTIVWPNIHSIPLAERLPHANLQLLDGIGHMPHHTSTSAMLDALDRLNQAIGA
jgi:pimeloyl-ACP methyl ester carboxylesterase